MGGEHRARRDQFQGAGEVHALGHVLAGPLEDLEGRMAFVDVPHRGVAAQGPQGAHATDAEDDLLLDTGVDVAAVQLVSDGTVFAAVFREVAVE